MSEQYPSDGWRTAPPGSPLPPPGPLPAPPAYSEPVASPLIPPTAGGWYVEPAPRKRRTGRLVVATVGVLALLGGGAFAAVALSGSDGASTPSAAVDGFFAALDHEDVLGMLDALPVGERDSLRPLAEELNSEVQRLGITSKIDLGRVKGLDIRVAGLRSHSQDLGDGVAGVWLDGGSITVNVVPQDVPIGDNLRNIIEHVTGAPVRITATSEQSTLHMDASQNPIVTIKEGGGWKLSAFYTAAEAMRRDAGAPLPDFGHGVDAIGSDGPEAAVNALADAAAAFDVEKLVALTPPEEMKALHEYAPLFLPDAVAAVQDMKSEPGAPTVTVSRLDLEASGSGDRRSVAIRGAALHVQSTAGSGDIDYDGACLTITGDLANDGEGGTQKECPKDIADADGQPGLGEIAGRLTQPAAITVVKEHGQWYVSPIGTVGEQALNLLRVLNPDDFQEGGVVFDLIDDLSRLGSDVTGGGG